jgi:hypothetical protein
LTGLWDFGKAANERYETRSNRLCRPGKLIKSVNFITLHDNNVVIKSGDKANFTAAKFVFILAHPWCPLNHTASLDKPDSIYHFHLPCYILK